MKINARVTRSLILLALAQPASVGQPAPGTPVYTVIGSLSCGVRQISPGQVQMWCYSGSGQARALIWNGVMSLNAAPNNPDIHTPAICSTPAYPETDGSESMITWLVYAGMNYQIAAQNCKADGCTSQAIKQGILP